MPSSPFEATSSLLLSEFVKKWSNTITSLKKARQLHALIITTTTIIPPQSPYLNNNILTIYARCGSLLESRYVFDTMLQRNLVSFNAMISAYSREPDHALSSIKLLTQLEYEMLRPNGSTFTSLLQASSSLKDQIIGSELHAKVVKFGFLNNVCVLTSLLGMYSKSRDLYSASKVFQEINNKDSMAWDSIIFGNFKNDKFEKGLNRYTDMVRSGAIPTQFTYSMILNACSKFGDHFIGQIIHAQLIISIVNIDSPLQNALLDMYCSCGHTKRAFSIFKRMTSLDLVSWNTMISGYSENGDGEKAMDLFIQFQGVSYAKSDEYTFAAIICGTGSFPALNYGMPLHAQVIKTGFKNSVYVGSTLVSMYLKNGETDSAQKVFYLIPHKDVILWTEMIAGHSKMANGESAIQFFQGMCNEGHKIDSFALSGALSACADLAILRQGEMIHTQVIKTGNFAEMSVCGSLIDMYAKNGSLDAANLLFSLVKNPDLKCWNSIIGGYSHHGKANEVFELFDKLLKHDLKPDQVTYLSMLSACSHCGLVEKGKYIWKSMKEHGFIPGIKHFSCMTSLLSRAGLLDKAEELIAGENNLELWRTLLSWCVIKGNIKIGIRAGEEVLRLDPRDNATHILVSNLYASEGKWDGVVEMRRNMRGMMLEKNPGLSWIECTKDIHVFSSGDQTHEKIDEAQDELHRLQGNMVKHDDEM